MRNRFLNEYCKKGQKHPDKHYLFTFIRLLNSMLYFNEALNDIFATLHDHHGNIACFQKEHETENTL